jgi:hypothetical protein
VTATLGKGGASFSPVTGAASKGSGLLAIAGLEGRRWFLPHDDVTGAATNQPMRKESFNA